METTTTSRRHALVPSACDVSITNVCNATCNFCSYAYDKQIVKDKRWIVRADLARALPILYRRGIRYLNFQGGEPLLHPDVEGLVADARAAGMRPTLITNGWLLPVKIEGLIAAGLGTLLVSIDSHELAEHERNRGLKGVGERVRQGLTVARRHRIPTLASVTVSRLVRFDLLPELLNRLGFDGVTFSYPRSTPLGSSSLVYNANSSLVRFDTEELVQTLEGIKSVRQRLPVLNPAAGVDDIQRHVRGQHEQFACIGGHKYFYLDWNLNIWRCEAWSKPLGSVFDLDSIPDCRDRCTACMMSCYRDTSVLMHAGVALEDAASALARGHPVDAARSLFRRSVARSLGAALAQTRLLLSLTSFRKRRPSLARAKAGPVEDSEARSVAVANP
jgi:MoaA/NifB/PqqE/SkfB family radical SAM enzyme